MQTLAEAPATVNDSDMSVMERRPWTKRLNRRLPLRFRDVLPQAQPSLPPAGAHTPLSPNEETFSSSGSLCRRLLQVFTSGRNTFGLSRRYEAMEQPSHDPEENVLLNELSDIPLETSTSETSSASFYPYPNRSSFLLGDWYWNGGVQKSQSSFKELVDIIVDPEFKATDIKETPWDNINRTLGDENDQGEWLDDDAGWINTPVTINVPYQLRRGIASSPSSGTQAFTIPSFYHRNLVAVIREKASCSADAQNFHYDPYELNWQRGGDPRLIRTYGELYTSPAFLDSHRDLQESPPEPGCNLPRVIIALMFWSDVTHLTSFGDAKVWPLYLFFGNESKYRRCKPSCNLCHHVAYFQKVSSVFFPHLSMANFLTAAS